MSFRTSFRGSFPASFLTSFLRSFTTSFQRSVDGCFEHPSDQFAGRSLQRRKGPGICVICVICGYLRVRARPLLGVGATQRVVCVGRNGPCRTVHPCPSVVALRDPSTRLTPSGRRFASLDRRGFLSRIGHGKRSCAPQATLCAAPGWGGSVFGADVRV